MPSRYSRASKSTISEKRGPISSPSLRRCPNLASTSTFRFFPGLVRRCVEARLLIFLVCDGEFSSLDMRSNRRTSSTLKGASRTICSGAHMFPMYRITLWDSLHLISLTSLRSSQAWVIWNINRCPGSRGRPVFALCRTVCGGAALPSLAPRSKTTGRAQELLPFPARHYVPARVDGKVPALSRTRASALRAPPPWIYC